MGFGGLRMDGSTLSASKWSGVGWEVLFDVKFGCLDGHCCGYY